MVSNLDSIASPMLTKHQPSSITLGKDAENQAKEFLQAQGLKFVASNYRCRFGEVDLIMDDTNNANNANNTGDLVFIEVRMRRSSLYGDAAATVDKTKLQKITNTIEYYMQKHYSAKNMPNPRLDLVAINGGKLEWLQNIQDC